MRKTSRKRKRPKERLVQFMVRIPRRIKAAYTAHCLKEGLSVSEKTRRDLEAALIKEQSENVLPLGIISWGVGKDSVKLHIGRSGSAAVLVIEGGGLAEVLEFIESIGSRTKRNRFLKQVIQTKCPTLKGRLTHDDDRVIINPPQSRKARS